MRRRNRPHPHLPPATARRPQAPPDAQAEFAHHELAEDVAWVGIFIGAAHHDLGDYETALVLFRSAQATLANLGDLHGEATCHMETGLTCTSIDRDSESVDEFTQL